MKKLHPDCIDPAKGLLELAACSPVRSLMVAGAGRSGTTAMMRVLSALGMRTVAGEGSATMEHAELLTAWGAGRPHRVDCGTINRLMTGNGRVVGKVPSAVLRGAVEPALSGVALDWIIVMRDVVPQVHYDRGAVPAKSPISALLGRSNLQHRVINGAVELARHGHGVLMVSYEVLMGSEQLELITAVAGLLGLDADDEAINCAVGEVRMKDKRYHGG